MRNISWLTIVDVLIVLLLTSIIFHPVIKAIAAFIIVSIGDL